MAKSGYVRADKRAYERLIYPLAAFIFGGRKWRPRACLKRRQRLS